MRHSLKLIIMMAIATPLILANEGGCGETTDKAAERQAENTRSSMNAADREVGMPRIVNFSQRKLLKNAYEDMDTTTLTYVYAQSAVDGKFLCLGQAIGYSISLGTQFTASQYPQYIRMPSGVTNVTEMIDQPEPNGLYMPSNGDGTIVNLINPVNGEAHTVVTEPNIITSPFKLPPTVVSVQCPDDVDPTKVKDAKETNSVAQRN